MTTLAPIHLPASRTYRGAITRPERWKTWSPRRGDILICTPPKCGTTWTQTMVAMLLHEGAPLPEPVPVLSPWVDVDLGVSEEDVTAAIERQPGRRVVKTHTPADGFPVWDGVTVIAVYRHPLDVFFSLRKHHANTRVVEDGAPMGLPVSQSLQHFLKAEADTRNIDEDNLATITLHYSETVLSGRIPGLKVFHYADLARDGHRAVSRIAQAIGCDANDDLIARVAAASSFKTMKANAGDYVPVGGTGYWKEEANFFDSATSGKWDGVLSESDVAAYQARLKDLVPDDAARHWLEEGDEA